MKQRPSPSSAEARNHTRSEDFAEGQDKSFTSGRGGPRSEDTAMANFLGYDLELTKVHNNSELRKILMKTSSKSIIVIEDIDCSIKLGNRKKSCSSGGNR
ncbi:unnamed protein product [Linum trigynum]|uniref:Uncharacterized protein n=1 Tax=Linum trigynum TaxID=586398 RepID=A0AAV2CW70_9ROSI